jgi:oligopeptide transport system substrate-binding protein
VRQAFALAVDREAVASWREQNGEGTYQPATVFTPPDILGRDLYGEVGLSFDPDRAQALLAEAGYPNGNGLPAIELGFFGTDTATQMLELIAATWQRNLGVEVTLRPYDDWGGYIDLLGRDAPQIFSLGWAADFNDPSNFLVEFTGESAGGIRTTFNNREFNALVEQAADLAGDPAARQRLYIQAEQILVEQEAAIIPLYHYHVNSE